jgi:hypothetical protein
MTIKIFIMFSKGFGLDKNIPLLSLINSTKSGAFGAAASGGLE